MLKIKNKNYVFATLGCSWLFR